MAEFFYNKNENNYYQQNNANNNNEMQVIQVAEFIFDFRKYGCKKNILLIHSIE